MHKIVIYFLLGFSSVTAYALIPLEGIIFGEAEDVKQYDPLSDILNPTLPSINLNEVDDSDFSKYYFGLFKQGSELNAYCEQNPKTNYGNDWNKETAARSIAATLQYIGLDQSLKFITSYAKELDFSKDKFLQFSSNLIKGTCSKNLSVYSQKLLKDNFKYAWENQSVIKADLKNSRLFFSENFKRKKETKFHLERKLEYTTRNFRAFCSWGGDTANFRLMVPYLKNPFIMSFIFNQLRAKKLSIEDKVKKVVLVDDNKTVKVACEDLICRKRDQEEFTRIFPRMVGSLNVKDDLYGMYCDYFKKIRYKKAISSKKINQWISSMQYGEDKLEALQFIANFTGIPDGIIINEKYSDIKELFVENVKARWDRWAKLKLNQFYNDQMYEEPLEIKLVGMSRTDQILRGEFQILFDVGLSEIDKVLTDKDKIDSVFYLNMPISYLAHIKQRYEYLESSAKPKEKEQFVKKVIARIKYQLKQKEKYFKIPIWNDSIAGIVADELIEQLRFYAGQKLNRISKQNIKIPVRFRFGVFALRYIREKFKYQNKAKVNLTFIN